LMRSWSPTAASEAFIGTAGGRRDRDGRPDSRSGRTLAWYAGQRYRPAAQLVSCGAAACADGARRSARIAAGQGAPTLAPGRVVTSPARPDGQVVELAQGSRGPDRGGRGMMGRQPPRRAM
jgi:hypothetical protein